VALQRLEHRLAICSDEVDRFTQQLNLVTGDVASAALVRTDQYGQRTRIGMQDIVKLLQSQNDAFVRLAASVAETHAEMDNVRALYLRLHCKGGMNPFHAADRDDAARQRKLISKLNYESEDAAAPLMGQQPTAAAPAAAATGFGFSGLGASAAGSTGFAGFGTPAATTGFAGFGTPAAAPAAATGFAGFGSPAPAPAPAAAGGFSFGGTPAAPAAGGFGGFGGFGAPATAAASPAAAPAAGGFSFGGAPATSAPAVPTVGFGGLGSLGGTGLGGPTGTGLFDPINTPRPAAKGKGKKK
jgi:hypothetical protein